MLTEFAMSNTPRSRTVTVTEQDVEWLADILLSTDVYEPSDAKQQARSFLASLPDAPTPERPMPSAWYCESCGEMRGCEVSGDEIVCPSKHIIATFEGNSRRAASVDYAPPDPMREWPA
jgi:hypothetical protein